MNDEEKKKEKYKDWLKSGVDGASYETIQRFGSAINQHFIAYSGIDNEKGKTLVKGLKQISEMKINPDYRYQNIHQQAGFSAEVKEVARSNAENIIKRNKITKTRTDDIGKVNDPLYDLVDIDEHGRVVEGSGEQMKFVGSSEFDLGGEGDGKRILDKLNSKKYEDKYLNKGAKIKIPYDKYDGVIDEIDSNIDKLSKQLKNSEDTEKIKGIESKINKLKKLKGSLTKSKISSKEAIFAREHPKLSTSIDTVKLSHEAGVECSKISASVQGIISIVGNINSVYNGDIEPEEAVINVAKDTVKAGAVGYAKGFISAPIKSAMQNSSFKTLRVLSKTNVPLAIAEGAYLSAETLKKYYEGEIDGLECLEILGDKGTGIIASSMFAVAGQILIPIPILGSVIGGMVGYSLSSATYEVLTNALKEAKLAKEEREQIERICNEQIKMIRQYREYMEKVINEYLFDYKYTFEKSFFEIKKSLKIDDVDLFIDNANIISKKFGGKTNFSNLEEFNDKMLKGETFKL